MSDQNFRLIEPFGAHHKKLRAPFSCESEALTRYIKEQATQDIARRACIVYVLTSDDSRLVGYYTLTQDSIDAEEIPTELIKQLNLPRYDRIGATLLGRLARDLTCKGQGVGELLLVDALRRALEMSHTIASAAVVVDAKDDKAHKFYQDFGFISFPDSKKRLFLPMVTIEELFPQTARGS